MESLGVVKHIFMVKFKADITPERIEDFIRTFGNLLTVIEPFKSLQWGEDISVENQQQGFTHVFECTFDNVEGRDTYLAHPAHVEFSNQILPAMEKFIVIDYKPMRFI
ncbi:stress-response A/B barrel domain-containing protein HS1 [Cryptomeria japonica]|uniref:stress-response A/B barrel domain-containing protein HS1 n=1 Tax=Cryptomeria japonica TaxID=3369 RepID=UPI0025AC5D28|nr:stress-response A/B barrel domain-containing protein HS1 [Cryptomeria japonica]